MASPSSSSAKNVMLKGFLLNGVPITQETYTELCNLFPDTYGDDAERIQREQRELRERTLRELSQSMTLRQSPSQVSLTPTSTPFTPSSKTIFPKTPSEIHNLSILVEDDEREPSPEAPLTKTTTQITTQTITPSSQVPKAATEPESVAESLQIIEKVVRSHLGTSQAGGRRSTIPWFPKTEKIIYN